MSKPPPRPATADSDIHSEISAYVSQLNAEISPENPISPYLEAYNSMFRAFDDAYNRNVRLVGLCQEMNRIVIMNATRIQDILTRTSNDRISLATLEEDFEQAQTELRNKAKHEKEMKQEIQDLRSRFDDLVKAADEKNRHHPELEEARAVVGGYIENKQTIEELQNGIATARAELEAHTRDLANLKTEFGWSESEIRSSEDAAGKEGEFKDCTEREMESLRADIEQMTTEKEEMERQLAAHRELVEKRRRELQDIQTHVTSIMQQGAAIKSRMVRKPKKLREIRIGIKTTMEEMEEIEKRMERAKQDESSGNEEIQSLDEYQRKLLAEYEGVMATKENLGSEKKSCKQNYQKLVTKKKELEVKLSKTEGEKSMDNRVIAVKVGVLGKTKMAEAEATTQAHNLREQQKTMMSEGVTQKQKIRVMKEQMGRIEDDVLKKRNDQIDLMRRIDSENDSSEVMKEENMGRLKQLAALKSRVDHQTELTDKLREERNTFKRQFEFCQAEQKEMEAQYNSLVRDIEGMTYRIDGIVDEIKKNRKLKAETQTAMDFLQKMEKKCRDGMKNTEEVVQKLQTAQQTLQRIYEESQHNQEQQQRDFQVQRSNFEMIKVELSAKSRHAEKLKSDIVTQNSYLNKCSELFRDKVAEIDRLTEELNKKMAKTEELEQKMEKLRRLELGYKCLFQEHAVERMKKMALYHEYDNPRNVSHIYLACAVDPGRVKEMRYLMTLSARINDADRHLRNLREKRDKMQKDAEKMIERAEGPNREEVEAEIERYTEHLKEKEEEVNEMRKMLEENRNGIAKQKDKTDNARAMVSFRKNMATSLRQSNEALRKSEQEKSDQYFVTEPPVVMPSKSCGFNLKSPRRVPSLNLVPETPEKNTEFPQSHRGPPVPKIKVPAMNTARFFRRKVTPRWR